MLCPPPSDEDSAIGSSISVLTKEEETKSVLKSSLSEIEQKADSPLRNNLPAAKTSIPVQKSENNNLIKEGMVTFLLS